MNKIIIVLFPFIFLLSYSSNTQEVVTLEREIDITFAGNNESLSLEAMIPQDIPNYQKVISINFSGEPVSTFFRGKNKFFKFDFPYDNVAFKEKIIIKTTLILYPYDFGNAKNKNKNINQHENLAPYLKKEPLINISDKKLIEVSSKISGDSREEIVRNIFDVVTDKMSYKYFGYKTRGASTAIRREEGGTKEYAEFMIALCRIKKVPARFVKGLYRAGGYMLNHHNWVEVYFEEYGWVAFDPTLSEFEYTKITFDNLPLNYISYSNDSSVPLTKWNWSGNPPKVRVKGYPTYLYYHFQYNKKGLPIKYFTHQNSELPKKAIPYKSSYEFH